MSEVCKLLFVLSSRSRPRSYQFGITSSRT